MTMKAKKFHGRLYAQKTATFQMQFLADLVGFPTHGDMPILNDSYLSPVFGEWPEKQLSRLPQDLPLLHLVQALADGPTKSRWSAVWPSSMIIMVIDHHHWSLLMISIDHHWWSLMSGIDHHWSALIIIHQHRHHQSSIIINHWSPSAATATATPFLL